MSADIQRARDVLAKWRYGTTPGPWSMVEDWGGDVSELRAEDGNALGWLNRTGNARLTIGTAGNPELLDAIDEMLAMWADWSRHGYVYVPDYVEHIAAAILAANERMSA